MKSTWAFFKKEFLENVISYHFFVLWVIFVLIGIVSPITAKHMPDILKNFDLQGVTIIVSETNVFDAWAQFFKTTTQMGIVVFILTYVNILTNEFSRGTMVNLLTRGLSKKKIILVKFFTLILIWSAVYFSAFLLTLFYSNLFWEESVTFSHLMLSVLNLWLFGVIFISAIMLGSVLFKAMSGCLVFNFAIFCVMLLTDMFKKLQPFNPMKLTTCNMEILYGNIGFAECRNSIISSIVVIFVMLILSFCIFKKREMV